MGRVHRAFLNAPCVYGGRCKLHYPGHIRDMFCDLVVEGETQDEFFDRNKPSAVRVHEHR